MPEEESRGTGGQAPVLQGNGRWFKIALAVLAMGLSAFGGWLYSSGARSTTVETHTQAIKAVKADAKETREQQVKHGRTISAHAARLITMEDWLERIETKLDKALRRRR